MGVIKIYVYLGIEFNMNNMNNNDNHSKYKNNQIIKIYIV